MGFVFGRGLVRADRGYVCFGFTRSIGWQKLYALGVVEPFVFAKSIVTIARETYAKVKGSRKELWIV